MKNKKADKPADQPKKKRGRPPKPRDTEQTVEREIDGGADYMASPQLKAKVPLNKVRGSREPFAAQGINNELQNAERCKLTPDDIHAPMARTSERTRRNVSFSRKP
jgi:hypothetical protein